MVKFLLREVREENHVSLRALSALSGVSKNYLSEIENGKANPTISVLCDIAYALDVPLDRIVQCVKNKT